MKTASELKTEGNQAFVAKDYPKAIQLYTQALEQDPQMVSVYSNRSGAYFNQGDFQHALEDAEQCIVKDPAFVKGYQRKGFALEKLGKKEEALQAFEEGLKLDPSNKQLEEGKKRCSFQQPQFNIQDLLNNPMVQQLIQKNPQLAQQLLQNPELLKNPQMMQMMMQMFQQQQAQQGQPGQGQPGQNQGPNQQFQGGQFNPQGQQQFHQPPPQPEKQPEPQQSNPTQPTQELSEWEKAKKEADQNYKKKNFDEAIRLYQKCIDLDKEHLIPRSNMAVCYIEQKDYDKALEVLDEAIKVYNETDFEKRSFENLAKVLEKKGRVFYLKGDLEQSIQLYEKSLMENHVGRVNAKLRELKREKKKREEEAYINPQLSEEHRQKGNEFYKAQKYPEAIKEYEEAQKRNPKDPKVYNNLCAGFIKLLRFDEAKKFAEKVLELEPNNIKAMLKQGTIYNFLKEYHKAMDVYKKILQLEPQNVEAQKGIQTTQMKIATSMQGESDEQRMQRAMADPEIQAIMIDPMVRIALEQMQKSPQTAMEYMNDKTLGPKINKLIQAGVLKVA